MADNTPAHEAIPIAPDERALDSFISGGLAGIFTKSVLAPFERTKLVFLTSNKKFSYVEAATIFMQIIKTEGVLGLWRGNVLNMMRVFPYTAIVD